MREQRSLGEPCRARGVLEAADVVRQDLRKQAIRLGRTLDQVVYPGVISLSGIERDDEI
jgi:hypothetical protein